MNATHEGHNMIYAVSISEEFNPILAIEKWFGQIQIEVYTKKASLSFSRTRREGGREGRTQKA